MAVLHGKAAPELASVLSVQNSSTWGLWDPEDHFSTRHGFSPPLNQQWAEILWTWLIITGLGKEQRGELDPSFVPSPTWWISGLGQGQVAAYSKNYTRAQSCLLSCWGDNLSSPIPPSLCCSGPLSCGWLLSHKEKAGIRQPSQHESLENRPAVL